MAERTRRTVATALLLLAVMFTASVSIVALTRTAIFASRRIDRYSEASEQRVSNSEAALLLKTLAQQMNPSQLTALRKGLIGIVQAGPTADNPLSDYAITLYDLSGNLTAIQTQLTLAHQYMAGGNQTAALGLLPHLQTNLKNAQSLLESSRSTLRQIREQYQIDTTTQTSKLNEFEQVLAQYSVQIDQLASATQVTLIQTILTFNSSAPQVFVGQKVRVFGSLNAANGTSMANRSVAISWAGSQVIVVTALKGDFEANVSFSPGSLPGNATITASYNPSAEDQLVFLGSSAQVQVQVFYEQSTLTAAIGPTLTKPRGLVDVWGSLETASAHKPLQNRTINIAFDGSLIGNTTTDRLGNFIFYFRVPANAENGTHTVETFFSPTNDQFGPSNSSLLFYVNILDTQVQLSLYQDTVLSGARFAINGTVGFSNTTFNQAGAPSGNVTVYFDNTAYANVTLDAHGTFLLVMTSSLGTGWGTHDIRVAFRSSDPGVRDSESTRTLNVISVPLLISALSLIAATSVIGTYATNRRRQRAVLRLESSRVQSVLQKPSLPDEFSRNNIIAALESERTEASKVAKAFQLAKAMVARALGTDVRDSETPSEYLTRINDAAPSLRYPLARLVELFELAEYSPFPIDADQANQSREMVLEIRKELDHVKTGETKH